MTACFPAEIFRVSAQTVFMVYGGKNGERAGLSTFLEKKLILPTSSPVHIHNDKKVSHGNTIIDHIGVKI